jgi:hypothetical protein
MTEMNFNGRQPLLGGGALGGTAGGGGGGGAGAGGAGGAGGSMRSLQGGGGSVLSQQHQPNGNGTASGDGDANLLPVTRELDAAAGGDWQLAQLLAMDSDPAYKTNLGRYSNDEYGLVSERTHCCPNGFLTAL